MLAFLKLIPLRWWIYLAAAAALGGLLWHDHHQTQRANRLATELAASDAKVSALKDAAAKDERIANELATFRTQQMVSLKAFDEKLKVTKFTREVRYETKEGSVVCVERNPATYRELHNEAVSGAPSPAGVP